MTPPPLALTYPPTSSRATILSRCHLLARLRPGSVQTFPRPNLRNCLIPASLPLTHLRKEAKPSLSLAVVGGGGGGESTGPLEHTESTEAVELVVWYGPAGWRLGSLP
jgi:hypothetical protein